MTILKPVSKKNNSEKPETRRGTSRRTTTTSTTTTSSTRDASNEQPPVSGPQNPIYFSEIAKVAVELASYYQSNPNEAGLKEKSAALLNTTSVKREIVSILLPNLAGFVGEELAETLSTSVQDVMRRLPGVSCPEVILRNVRFPQKDLRIFRAESYEKSLKNLEVREEAFG
jgi:hypothetical protein